MAIHDDDDDLAEIPSIVPNRDDYSTARLKKSQLGHDDAHAHTGQARGRSTTPVNAAQSGGRLGSRILLALTVVLTGWVALLQFELVEAKHQNHEMLMRLDAIDKNFSTTDTTLLKSSEAFAAKLAQHDTALKSTLDELRKTTEWARKGQDGDAARLQKLDKSLDELRSAVTKQGEQITATATDIATTKQLAQEAAQRIEMSHDEMQDTLKRIEKVEKQVGDVNKAQNQTEEAIRGNDVFRKGTNSRLDRIEQQLRPQSTGSSGFTPQAQQ